MEASTELNERVREITLQASVPRLTGHPLTHVNEVHIIERIRPWLSFVGVGGRRWTGDVEHWWPGPIWGRVPHVPKHQTGGQARTVL